MINKVDTKKLTTASKQRNPIMNRLQKYSMGSQSLALLSGVLGQTAICSASVQVLNLDGPNIGDTFIAGGGGSAGDLVNYLLDSSPNSSYDKLRFLGTSDVSGAVFLDGISGAVFFSTSTTSSPSPLLYEAGDIVDGSLTTAPGHGYIYRGLGGGALGVWSVDRTGAIGFKTADNQFGYVNVAWDVSEKTLTILGGSYESTASTGITVTAVPEPSEYAAALGLGALGLTYYRRRPGNKTRAKNN